MTHDLAAMANHLAGLWPLNFFFKDFTVTNVYYLAMSMTNDQAEDDHDRDSSQ